MAYLMSFDGRGAKNGYCPGGVKCIALYRDGSKRAQPLNNPTDMAWWDGKREHKPLLRGERKRQPRKRAGILHEVTIKDNGQAHKFTVTFGEYDDGSLCEIWIDVANDNPDFQKAMEWAGRAMSNAIQYGLPLEDLANSYLLNRGGPAGKTDHPYITHCTSIIDFVMKLMLLEYQGDTTYCTKRPRPADVRIGQITKTNHKTALHGVNGNNGNGNGHNRLAASGVLTETVVKQQVGAGCPKCGSNNIQRFPCPTCLNCSASLGGCTA
jgi:ribonucleoside-diphosphate reductase alpha chain